MKVIFEDIEERKAILTLINIYIDDWYQQATNRQHNYVSVAGRSLFAGKVLDCMIETGASINDMQNTLASIVVEETIRGKDPLIYYATTPRVLGYWLIQQEGFNYDNVLHTIYAPVDDYYN